MTGWTTMTENVLTPPSPPGPPDLVVLDCDGVLLDSERISVSLWTGIFGELGWRLTEQQFAELFVGCNSHEWHDGVARGLGTQLAPGWDDAYRDRHHEAFRSELTPVPGVVDVLDRLDTVGVPYCVASNSDHAYLERWLTHTGLWGRVDGRVFSAQDVHRGKPEPDLYLLAAQTLGVEPDHCMVVEDSPFGVRAAHAAGMRCVAFAGGVTPEHRFEGLNATVFHDMGDLPALLGVADGVARPAGGQRAARSG
jgi:HAD superfamily hydrolase (TIGR01509 family)